jgi:hypothetical protein
MLDWDVHLLHERGDFTGWKHAVRNPEVFEKAVDTLCDGSISGYRNLCILAGWMPDKAAAQELVDQGIRRLSGLLAEMTDEVLKAVAMRGLTEEFAHSLRHKPRLGAEEVRPTVDVVLKALYEMDFHDQVMKARAVGAHKWRHHIGYPNLPYIRESMTEGEVPQKEWDAVYQALIDIGAAPLGELRRKDCTIERLTPALRRYPERLTELARHEDVAKMARALGIPSGLPAGADQAAQMHEVMAEVLEGQGGLAEAAVAPRRAKPVR